MFSFTGSIKLEIRLLSEAINSVTVSFKSSMRWKLMQRQIASRSIFRCNIAIAIFADLYLPRKVILISYLQYESRTISLIECSYGSSDLSSL